LDPARTGHFHYLSRLLIRWFHTFTALLFVSLLSSQNGITGHPDWQIKPVFSQGFILVHRISIGHLVKGYPAIYEVNVSKPTLGNKLWHRENNHPDIGVTFQYMDYRNPAQLGYAYTAAPYIEVPFNRIVRATRLVMRLSWGVTYISKSFDIQTNHKNIAIGSPWNCFAQFRWFWQLPLNRYLRFEPGITFSHASNGRARNPNLGLNVVTLTGALNMVIPSKSKAQVTVVDSSTRVLSRNELLFVAATGMNERRVNSANLRSSLVSLAYQRNVRNTHKFSLGVDVFLDENYTLDYEVTHGKLPTGLDRTRMAARIGYSYNVGRVSLPIEAGYYFLQKTYPDGFIVSRVGLRYYSASGLVVHFGLRTHFAVAYNFEFGLGYRFYLK
jgi:hypothetical protein